MCEAGAAEVVTCVPRDVAVVAQHHPPRERDRKSTRLNSSHLVISYAVFCLKKKKKNTTATRTCPPTMTAIDSTYPLISTRLSSTTSTPDSETSRATSG